MKRNLRDAALLIGLVLYCAALDFILHLAASALGLEEPLRRWFLLWR